MKIPPTLKISSSIIYSSIRDSTPVQAILHPIHKFFTRPLVKRDWYYFMGFLVVMGTAGITNSLQHPRHEEPMRAKTEAVSSETNARKPAPATRKPETTTTSQPEPTTGKPAPVTSRPEPATARNQANLATDTTYLQTNQSFLRYMRSLPKVKSNQMQTLPTARSKTH